MMKKVRRILMMAAFVAASAASLGQPTDPRDTVCATSRDLTAYSATIRMTQHQARSDSVIEFRFDFVPPDRMRIVYTAPAAVVDQTMILNGDKLYTYIPSLRRHIWQDVDDGEGNQGEEMGFLYDFVTQSASEALKQATAEVANKREPFTLESTGGMLDAHVLTLLGTEERQVVLLNTVDAAPVAVSIHHGDHMVMEVRVLGYEINGDFEEAWFAIPEK